MSASIFTRLKDYPALGEDNARMLVRQQIYSAQERGEEVSEEQVQKLLTWAEDVLRGYGALQLFLNGDADPKVSGDQIIVVNNENVVGTRPTVSEETHGNPDS